MQKFAMVFSLIVLVACAAPAPTVAPKPTSAPAPMPTAAAKPTSPPPTRAPAATATTAGKSPIGPASKATTAPTPQSIKLENVKKDKQADGSSLTRANVTAPDNLGLGQIELASPDAMLLSETRTIRLRLSPAQQLTSLTPVAAPGKTPDVPNFLYRLSGNVQLYPVMFAELRALAFDADQKGPVRRLVEANKPVEWAWVVKPLAEGRHELTLELSIPMVVNGVNTEMSTHVLQDLTIAIQVAAQPIVPTATPRTTTDRIGDSMIEHSGALLAALIGIFGTLLGGLFALLRRRS
ncbi:MAG: hypothetical protein FJ009_02970 [Chloroflexi bacterium]|nr:hypothetical protein [Chloroflexota bacterium]